MLNGRLIILILVLSAVALLLSYQHESENGPLYTSSLQSTDYSWQLFNSTTWQLNKTLEQSGSITQTSTLFYNEATRTSVFTKPHITLIEADQTLFIESQTGRSINNSDFELNGQVIFTQHEQPIQTLDQAEQNKTLTTEYITYNSIAETISSDQVVTITQPDAIIIGTGLNVDLKSRHFQLLSDVTSEYRPLKTPN